MIRLETPDDLRALVPTVAMRAVFDVLGRDGTPPSDVADAIRMLTARGRRDGMRAASENDPDRNGPWTARRQARLAAYSAGAVEELVSLVRLEIYRETPDP